MSSNQTTFLGALGGRSVDDGEQYAASLARAVREHYEGQVPPVLASAVDAMTEAAGAYQEACGVVLRLAEEMGVTVDRCNQ